MSAYTLGLPMPGVRRVETPSGSFIDPPLDSAWTEMDRLRWLTAVVREDTGLVLTVAHFTESNTFGVTGHGRSLGATSYAQAWRTIVDLGCGAEMFQRACPTRGCGDPA